MAATLDQFACKKPLHGNTTSSGGIYIASNLTDFPVCVHIVGRGNKANLSQKDRDLFFRGANYNNSGKSVQFFDVNLNNLPYEVEYFSEAYSEAIYWVKVPTVNGNSSNTNMIWMGFGNDPNNLVTQDQPLSVWTSYYIGWHLGNNAWGSSPEAKDFNNLYNGTNVGTIGTSGYTIGSSREFDGTDDEITITLNPSTAGLGSQLTFSAWVYPHSQSNYRGIAGWHASNQGAVFFQYDSSGGQWYVFYGNGTGYGTGCGVSPTLLAWQQLHGIINAGSYTKTYKNGAFVNQVNRTDSISHTTIFRIGRAYNATGRFFDGSMKYLRLSKDIKTDDWIKLEYNTSAVTTGFMGDSWLNWGATVYNSNIGFEYALDDPTVSDSATITQPSPLDGEDIAVSEELVISQPDAFSEDIQALDATVTTLDQQAPLVIDGTNVVDATTLFEGYGQIQVTSSHSLTFDALPVGTQSSTSQSITVKNIGTIGTYFTPVSRNSLFVYERNSFYLGVNESTSFSVYAKPLYLGENNDYLTFLADTGVVGETVTLSVEGLSANDCVNLISPSVLTNTAHNTQIVFTTDDSIGIIQSKLDVYINGVQVIEIGEFANGFTGDIDYTNYNFTVTIDCPKSWGYNTTVSIEIYTTSLENLKGLSTFSFSTQELGYQEWTTTTDFQNNINNNPQPSNTFDISSGSLLPATIAPCHSSLTYTPGFDGSSSYITYAVDNAFPQWTLEAWIIYHNNNKGTRQPIYGAWGDSFDWGLQISLDGKVEFVYNAGLTYQVTPALTMGVPYHIATTYDGTNAKVYINGELKLTQAITLYMTQVTTCSGRDVSCCTNYFQGYMWDIAHWSMARSAAQIKRDMYDTSVYQYQELSGSPVSVYKRPLTIYNEGASTLSDYIVKIVFNSAALVTANKMRSDCGDLRFKDSDGSTTLPYFIEGGENTASTIVWVKMPTIPSGSRQIYMYYGTLTDTSQSTTTIYDFYDTFTTITGWTEKHYDSSGAVSAQSGWARVYNNGSGEYSGTADGGSGIFKSCPLSDNYAVETKFRSQAYPGSGNGVSRFFMLRADSAAAGSAFYGLNIDTNSRYITTVWRDTLNGSYGTYGDGTGWRRGAQTTMWARLTKIGSNYTGWISGNGYSWGQMGARSSGVYHGTIGLTDSGGASQGYMEFDWVRVRKYATPEPYETFGNLVGYWGLTESSGNFADRTGRTTGTATSITRYKLIRPILSSTISYSTAVTITSVDWSGLFQRSPKIQIAVRDTDSTDLADWDFVGYDGTTSTFFDSTHKTATATISGKYVKYRIFINHNQVATGTTYTPIMEFNIYISSYWKTQYNLYHKKQLKQVKIDRVIENPPATYKVKVRTASKFTELSNASWTDWQTVYDMNDYLICDVSDLYLLCTAYEVYVEATIASTVNLYEDCESIYPVNLDVVTAETDWGGTIPDITELSLTELEWSANMAWGIVFEDTLSSASDYDILNLNGDVDRYYLVLLTGVLTNSSNIRIGLRPNYDTVAGHYGSGIDAIDINATGSYSSVVSNVGSTNTILPLGGNYWSANGRLTCKALINASTGVMRICKSEWVFVRDSYTDYLVIGQSSNMWTDTTANITSLTLYFNGATNFSGNLKLLGLRT